MKRVNIAALSNSISGISEILKGQSDILVFPANVISTYDDSFEYLIYLIESGINSGKEIYIDIDELCGEKYLSFLRKAEFWFSRGVQGVIVSSLSLLQEIRKSYPNIKIITGESLGVYDKYSISFLKKEFNINGMLFQPAVSLEKIKEISKTFQLDFWFCVFGKHCSCFKGICFLTEYISGRKKENLYKCLPESSINFRTKKHDEIRCGNYLLDRIRDDESLYIPYICRARLKNSLTNEIDNFINEPGTINYISHLSDTVNSGIKTILISGENRSPLFFKQSVPVFKDALDLFYTGEYKSSKMEGIRLKLNNLEEIDFIEELP
ncbi:MAG: U32 family peptidase [Actinomycetia bacterium]|nr:U32 family peptidase [Actinomycetes bacterium]